MSTPSKAAKAAIQVSPDDVAFSPFQLRISIDGEELKGLAQSIAEVGILEPILIRLNTTDSEQKYELISGERRLRAWRMLAGNESGEVAAGDFDSIPAILKDWDDRMVQQAQLIENIQREDLHPMEQALYMKSLIAGVPPLTVKELSLRVGKSERDVARTLSLNDLIEPAKADFMQGNITVGHAYQLSRLSPEIQPEALEMCFERNFKGYDDNQKPIYETVRDQPTDVSDLITWIGRNVVHALSRAPWKLDDAELVPEQGPCTTCAFNTAANALLFPDSGKDALCTNAAGWQRKVDALVAQKVSQIMAKDKVETVPLLTELYNRSQTGRLPAGVLMRPEYKIIEKDKGKCEFTVRGVMIEGASIGKVVKVCVTRTCKDHFSQYIESGRHDRGKAVPEKKRLERKQEIFDIKVADKVRERVFDEAYRSFGPKLPRPWLERVATTFFRRIPNNDATVINRVLGRTGQKNELSTYSDESTNLAKLIAIMNDREFAGFLALCSFAHFGSNFGGHHMVNQRDVITLAEERSIDYALIDAEVRLELSPKKHIKAHEEYLVTAKKGLKTINPPQIFASAATPKKKPAAKKKAAAKKVVAQKRSAKKKAASA
jgi:ParB family chromosome partitioning protein